MHQVVYTTHSPFMVDARSHERDRAVEDTDAEGAQVQDDVLRVYGEHDA